MSKIRTVLGDINTEVLGLTLSHEHVICDFIGAYRTNKYRYDQEEVLEVMLPYLMEIRQLGVTGFVDCTPAYIGRDEKLLARLSKESNIHILTNTGLYKEPFLPRYVFELPEDEVAKVWIREIEEGINGTDIRAGFIKIAVNPGKIIPIQKKIIRAAVQCSLHTGAPLMCHTGEREAAMGFLKISLQEGIDPNKLIVAHCDSIEDIDCHIKIAKSGAWLGYDGIGASTFERDVQLIKVILENGLDNRLLLSQDAGWYNVGESRGGKIRGYSFLINSFIPRAIKKGLRQDLVERMLVRNPAMAFQMG
ncbi:MAG: aryldialkylphosphatase [Thermoproteota archaeon]